MPILHMLVHDDGLYGNCHLVDLKQRSLLDSADV